MRRLFWFVISMSVGALLIYGIVYELEQTEERDAEVRLALDEIAAAVLAGEEALETLGDLSGTVDAMIEEVDGIADEPTFYFVDESDSIIWKDPEFVDLLIEGVPVYRCGSPQEGGNYKCDKAEDILDPIRYGCAIFQYSASGRYDPSGWTTIWACP